MTKPIGGILLAAGKSRRFGGDKRKTLLADGRSLLQTAIEQAAAALDTLVVVLRADDTVLKTRLEETTLHLPGPPRFILAAHAERGMAHSLADAMHATAGWRAALVLLGDMPAITPATFSALLGAYDTAAAIPGAAPIIVPAYRDRQGHPVLFDCAYFAEMAALQGDRGARSVIDHHADQVTRLALADNGILQDIDTPADLGD